MNMKTIETFFMLLILIVVPVTGTISALVNENDENYDPLDGGWLEERDGVKILHVSGSHYEMGYQHGFLLGEECTENKRAFLNFLEQLEISYDDLLEYWNVAKNYIPLEYKNEMQGMAEGSEISFEDVVALNMLVSIYRCFGIAAWGPATSDSKLYHAYSLDYLLTVVDPITGTYAHENYVLIIREPDNGYASLNPSFAGMAGSVGGINENGIGTGVEVSWSDDETICGAPMIFRQKMLLDLASTADEAIEIINSNTTLGWNFIISDGKIPMGYAVEQSANYSYVGSWDDPIESTRPFWGIDHVVRRTNFFIYPSLAATQRDRYHPGGLNGLLCLLFSKNFCFFPWRNYVAVSNEIEQLWGDINLNNTMSTLREVYNGKTDIFLSICARIASGTGFLEPWYQWVACPETGDMTVSFASADKKACENPVHYFNLFQLLNSNPPP